MIIFHQNCCLNCMFKKRVLRKAKQLVNNNSISIILEKCLSSFVSSVVFIQY